MKIRWREEMQDWRSDPSYEWSKVKEKAVRWLAWKMPRKLAYWCALRVVANATTGEWRNQIVPDLTAMDALQRWYPEEPVSK